MLSQIQSYPAPRWRMTTWLLSTPHAIPNEAVGAMRASMFRRMPSLLASAVAGVVITGLAVARHTTASFQILFAVGVALLVLRAALVVLLLRWMAQPRGDHAAPTWLVDLFVTAGAVWCAYIGVGMGLCMMADDPSLGVLASFMMTATVGALCARNPGVPRLTAWQMGLIVTPFMIGAWMSGDPVLTFIVALTPLYILSMASINRRLHADYVEMIGARFETKRRALHCALTGLPNRVLFDATLKDATARAGEDARSVCVMGLDLDGFKVINDTFGHPAGDRLLVLVAERLRSLLRPDDLVARLGGDEFGVILRSDSAAEADAMATLLIETISQPYFLIGAGSVTIGLSIGIAAGNDAELLATHADAALYAAKRAGRGTFRWHWAEDAIAARSLHDIARRMRAA